MNRKKQIIIFLTLIPLLFFSFLRHGGYYFSPEGVFYACERGLQYGPSDKIVAEYDLSEGGTLVVGKWGGDLSAIPAERAFGFLWRLKSGGVTGFISCEKVVTGYMVGEGRIIGLAAEEQMKEVYCRVEYGEIPSIQEITMPVDEDGYFTGIWGTQKEEEKYEYIAYIEGRSAGGEVLYRDGMDAYGRYFEDGVERNLDSAGERVYQNGKLKNIPFANLKNTGLATAFAKGKI